MKANREHRVALCRPAVEILDAVRTHGDSPDPLVFTNGAGESRSKRRCRAGCWSGSGSRCHRSRTGRRRRRAPARGHRAGAGACRREQELLEHVRISFLSGNPTGAALLRRRPMDPSTHGRSEEAAKGTGVRRYLCRQRPLGVFRSYSRASWKVAVRIKAPAAPWPLEDRQSRTAC